MDQKWLRLLSFIPDRSLISDAAGTSVFTPPAQSQSTVGQSNESLRIRPLLRCCNCTTATHTQKKD